MSGTAESRKGTRGGERDEQHDGHAQQQQQRVARLEFTRVLLLRAQEVTHGGKVQPHLDLAPAQVQPERHRRGQSEQQREGGKQAHGSRWRERKARRTGTTNGAFVKIGSYDAPAPASRDRHSPIASSTVAR